VLAASPGVLTLDTPAETYERIRNAVRALARARIHYHVLHEWSRLKPEDAKDLPKLELARRHVKNLCDALDVDPAKLYSQKQIPSGREKEAVLVAGKLVAAYYRVLIRVVRPKDAEFVGVNLDDEQRLQDEIDESDEDEDED
jgi:hypothetical protein